MLTIPCIIFYSEIPVILLHYFHAKLFSRSLSKQSRSSQNDSYFIAKHDYSIRVIIIQPTSLIMS